MTARALAALAAGLLAGACSDTWLGDTLFGDDEAADALPGERVSVLLLERTLEADPALAGEPVTLPPPLANAAWPVPWGTPTHAPGHLAADGDLAVLWRQSAGAGESGENIALSTPVVADGRAYLMDADSTVAAFALESGRREWSRELLPDHEDGSAILGGGVAFADGVLYAATAFGEIAALDAADGAVLWRRTVVSALRAAPAVAGGRLFATGFDNRLFAFDARTGELLWTHEGIVESAGLAGAAVPAVSGDLVIAAYSSGEVFALRVENGRVAWTDSLILQGRLGARTNLSDVDASPVVDGDLAFAVSQGGSLAAIELRSGFRVWDQEIPSAQTPWVAGDYLYIVTVDAEVACLRRVDGRVRWVAALPRYEDPEDREDPIQWTGPVLAGGRLVVASSHGELRELSPADGEVLAVRTLPAGVRAAPVVADGTLYVRTREADLVALR